MTEKRFTTVELPKPNKWGIWYDGAYLSTYQVCILLNEYVDIKKENEQLKEALIELKEIGDYQYARIKELSDENEQLEKILNELSDMLQFDVENGIRSYPVKLSEYLSNALKEL